MRYIAQGPKEAGRVRLSVALCTYNGARYLGEQLQSIANQRRLPDEVVVSDDGSTDGTVDIVRNFASSVMFPVHLSVNESNLGISKNFEMAIGLCLGDVIVLSDQDDSWYDTRLDTIERCFLNDAFLGVVFSDADLMDENSDLMGKRLWKTFGLSQRGSKQPLDVMFRHNVVYGATMAFRSKLRDIVLPIPEIATHDFWIAFIASLVSDIMAVPTPLIKYRKHSAQQVGVLYDGLCESVEKSKRVGAVQYLSEATQYAMARDRIKQHRSPQDIKRQIDLVDGKVRHMKMRSALPPQRWRRLPMIVSHIANGDYFHYSEGYKSIAKDLIF